MFEIAPQFGALVIFAEHVRCLLHHVNVIRIFGTETESVNNWSREFKQTLHIYLANKRIAEMAGKAKVHQSHQCR